MNEAMHPDFSDAELDASLQDLGATELEQRLEFAPLLLGTGGDDETTLGSCRCDFCPCDEPKHVSDIAISTGPTDGSDLDPFSFDNLNWGTGR